MLDTNSINQIGQAAPVAQQAFDAWMIVAAAGGAFITHIYHTVVSGGGLKNIWKKFWRGEPAPTAQEAQTQNNKNP